MERLGDWAFMRQRLSVRMAPADDAPPVKRGGHTLTLFKKQSGQWRLARDANLLIRIAD